MFTTSYFNMLCLEAVTVWISALGCLGARFAFGCLISDARKVRLFDFVVNAGTSLWMSRSWEECWHLAPDVSILERVSVLGPGCIREGCMSTYMSCTGMSRRTYGNCGICVYKEGCLPYFVFFFSSCKLLYSIWNINLVTVSSVSSVSSILPSRRCSSSAACPCLMHQSDVVRPCPTRPSDTVRLSVRHVHLTLSISLSNTSV